MFAEQTVALLSRFKGSGRRGKFVLTASHLSWNSLSEQVSNKNVHTTSCKQTEVRALQYTTLAYNLGTAGPRSQGICTASGTTYAAVRAYLEKKTGYLGQQLGPSEEKGRNESFSKSLARNIWSTPIVRKNCSS